MNSGVMNWKKRGRTKRRRRGRRSRTGGAGEEKIEEMNLKKRQNSETKEKKN